MGELVILVFFKGYLAPKYQIRIVPIDLSVFITPHHQVCNPHRIAQQKDCLIYSVGSNGKAEFEKAVHEEIGDHCEVHSEFCLYFYVFIFFFSTHELWG